MPRNEPSSTKFEKKLRWTTLAPVQRISASSRNSMSTLPSTSLVRVVTEFPLRVVVARAHGRGLAQSGCRDAVSRGGQPTRPIARGIGPGYRRTRLRGGSVTLPPLNRPPTGYGSEHVVVAPPVISVARFSQAP